jgi:hypothetical protein
VTMTRELLERSGTAAAGEMSRTSSDRLRQDGIIDKQTVPSNGAATLAEATAWRPARLALQFAIEAYGFDRCGRFFYRTLGNLKRQRWRMQVLPAHGSGSPSDFSVACD